MRVGARTRGKESFIGGHHWDKIVSNLYDVYCDVLTPTEMGNFQERSIENSRAFEPLALGAKKKGNYKNTAPEMKGNFNSDSHF